MAEQLKFYGERSNLQSNLDKRTSSDVIDSPAGTNNNNNNKSPAVGGDAPSPSWEGFRPPLGHVEDKACKKARTWLSGLDRGFLVGEDEKTWYHLRVSMLMVFDGPIDRDAYAERLDRWSGQYPIFRRRIKDRYAFLPKWEDAVDFDVCDHLHEVALVYIYISLLLLINCSSTNTHHTQKPEPGGDEELRAMISKLQNEDFDFKKPLWGHVIITGYKGSSLSEITINKIQKQQQHQQQQSATTTTTTTTTASTQKKQQEYTLVLVSCHHCIGDGHR